MYPEAMNQEALDWAIAWMTRKPRRAYEVLPAFDGARRARTEGRRDAAAEGRLVELMTIDRQPWSHLARRIEIDEDDLVVFGIRDTIPRWQIMKNGAFYATIVQWWNGFWVSGGGLADNSGFTDPRLAWRAFCEAK